MKKGRMKMLAVILFLCFLTACGTEQAAKEDAVTNTAQTDSERWLEGGNRMNDESGYLSGIVPEELKYIPEGFRQPSGHPGTLEKLTYQTWESFSYEERTQELTKEAWIYLPYGYSSEQKYNVFYLSHGGWSNETTVMGTDRNPRDFKNVIDNAIENREIQPLIIVLPTYNNLSGSDSGNYSLALQLTDQFHNELVNDLMFWDSYSARFLRSSRS